eukprot:SAG11_NODE_2990_length_2786_cov_4.823570_2_plen_85_part_00
MQGVVQGKLLVAGRDDPITCSIASFGAQSAEITLVSYVWQLTTLAQSCCGHNVDLVLRRRQKQSLQFQHTQMYQSAMQMRSKVI